MRQGMKDKRRMNFVCNVLFIVLNIEVNLTEWQQLLIVCGVYLGDFLVFSAIFKFLKIK